MLICSGKAEIERVGEVALSSSWRPLENDDEGRDATKLRLRPSALFLKETLTCVASVWRDGEIKSPGVSFHLDAQYLRFWNLQTHWRARTLAKPINNSAAAVQSLRSTVPEQGNSCASSQVHGQ